MSRALLLSVRFHDGRYHGRPEWPPSPARLFQALVAGAARGKALSVEDREALTWLEKHGAPFIAAPAVRVGNGFTNYVPNNDRDVVEEKRRRGTFNSEASYQKAIAKQRAPKIVKPHLFDACMSLLYAWQFDQGEEHAETVCGIAERLYQLGRGVDMAWASAEIVDASDIELRLAAHGGVLYRPAGGDGGTVLPCPQEGSLKTLEDRFDRAGRRFSAVGSGRQQLFSQAPKFSFQQVAYDSPPERFLFDLRGISEDMDFAAQPLARAASLIEHLRDKAAERLQSALPPDQAACIERALVGRGATEADKAARIRIMPIPSIGSQHVVRSIRRVLVEVPGNCPLPSEAVRQAFSGLPVSERIDPQTGEVLEDVRVVPAEDSEMLRHYGVSERNRWHLWRTVTPAALPDKARRRRIDPDRLRAELAAARGSVPGALTEAKGSRERLDEEVRAAAAVIQALRHAGISTPVETIRVQREPFEGRGLRAEAFAEGTRFAKERLWHVEITFADAVSGPLVIGDGRYLGLGLMAPVRGARRDVLVFPVPREAAVVLDDAPALVHAARRALMALSRNRDRSVPRLFSGHEPDGERAKSGRHEHIFLAADDHDQDGVIDRLIVAAPWACDQSLRPERGARGMFEDVVSRLEVLRAGRLGVIALGRPVPFAGDDALVGPARVWESRTPYRATRHAGRRKDPAAALMRDLAAECIRRGLPMPAVKLLDSSVVPNGGGLTARAQLRFATAVRGPLLLGRDSHRGGGLFAAGH